MARGKRYLWMGHEDGMVVVWHAHSKQPLTAPFAAFKSAIRCVWRSCVGGGCVQQLCVGGVCSGCVGGNTFVVVGNVE